MLLRALFWISLVWLLMPREPDLGYGRPGSVEVPRQIAAWVSRTSADAGGVCRARESLCETGTDFLDSFRSIALRSLARVKLDIETAQRLRARNG